MQLAPHRRLGQEGLAVVAPAKLREAVIEVCGQQARGVVIRPLHIELRLLVGPALIVIAQPGQRRAVRGRRRGPVRAIPVREGPARARGHVHRIDFRLNGVEFRIGPVIAHHVKGFAIGAPGRGGEAVAAFRYGPGRTPVSGDDVNLVGPFLQIAPPVEAKHQVINHAHGVGPARVIGLARLRLTEGEPFPGSEQGEGEGGAIWGPGHLAGGAV